MKKYIIIFIAILFCGCVLITLPHILSAKKINDNTEKKIKIPSSIDSNSEFIEQPEISFNELEPEIYSKDQIYFKNAEILYKKTSFFTAENIKEKLQMYHNNIKNKVIEIKDNSIVIEDKVITFSIEADGTEEMVCVTINEVGDITDISISHSNN